MVSLPSSVRLTILRQRYVPCTRSFTVPPRIGPFATTMLKSQLCHGTLYIPVIRKLYNLVCDDVFLRTLSLLGRVAIIFLLRGGAIGPAAG